MAKRTKSTFKHRSSKSNPTQTRARRYGGNPVKWAVEAIGGPLRAAVIMGVSLRTTYEWIRKGEIRLLKPALRLARASGVRVEEFGGKQDEDLYLDSVRGPETLGK